MSKQMDAYSNMRVPFAVAAWARAHRFNPVAVDILRALRRIDEANRAMELAEDSRSKAESELDRLCGLAQTKMEQQHV